MPRRSATQRAQKFTPIRRQVLGALLSSHRPLGAYEVIDELAKSMPRPAPITVYRALDFLMANGLVHRIESRNAYLACAAHDHDATSAVAFLICERCGLVGEIPSASFAGISTPRRAAQASHQNCPWWRSRASAPIVRKLHKQQRRKAGISGRNVRTSSQPSAARPLSAGAIALMLMLCLTWGFNQIAVKLVLPEIPPMLQAMIRSMGALPVLFIIGSFAASNSSSVTARGRPA